MTCIRQLVNYLLLAILLLSYGTIIADIGSSSTERDQRVILRKNPAECPTLLNRQGDRSQRNSIENEVVSDKMDEKIISQGTPLNQELEVNQGSERVRSQRSPSKSQSNYSDPNWIDIRWRYRKNITIDASKVSTDLINFPVLIDLYDTDLKQALTSGSDIFFTDASGIKLAHEIESYDRFYSSIEAHLVAWVKANLSSTDDTIISMYYGNPFAESQENPTAVWDNDYAAVWHLSEDPTGTIHDSTSNDNDGVSVGSMTSSDQINGLIDGSLDFDGINDYISVPQNPSLDFSSSGIISGWFKLDSDFSGSSITSQIILEKYLDNYKNFIVILVGTDYTSINPTDGSLCFKVENGGYIYTYTSQTSWSADTWYY
ncbi:MAG: DUF2341 domain-containing protein, partial [Candidatus Hodarchaeota archaeon]